MMKVIALNRKRIVKNDARWIPHNLRVIEKLGKKSGQMGNLLYSAWISFIGFSQQIIHGFYRIDFQSAWVHFPDSCICLPAHGIGIKHSLKTSLSPAPAGEATFIADCRMGDLSQQAVQPFIDPSVSYKGRTDPPGCAPSHKDKTTPRFLPRKRNCSVR